MNTLYCCLGVHQRFRIPGERVSACARLALTLHAMPRCWCISIRRTSIFILDPKNSRQLANVAYGKETCSNYILNGTTLTYGILYNENLIQKAFNPVIEDIAIIVDRTLEEYILEVRENIYNIPTLYH